MTKYIIYMYIYVYINYIYIYIYILYIIYSSCAGGLFEVNKWEAAIYIYIYMYIYNI